MSKQVYTAKDISEILGVSESKSYQYIRQMNKELEENSVLMFWKSLKQNKIRRAACEVIERS